MSDGRLTLYIDTENGFDGNSGRSPDQPYRSRRKAIYEGCYQREFRQIVVVDLTHAANSG